MKLSYNWLKSVTGMAWGVDLLSNRLTMVGIEVEYAEDFMGELPKNVVAGKIVDILPMKGSHNLITRVDVGGAFKQIVCGAHNISIGDIVPVALPGSVIYGGKEVGIRSFGEIRSEGMLCSEEELLGFSVTGESGIMILCGDIKLGDDIVEVLGLKDVIIDVSVTPNRADCLSVLGVSREIAAMLGKGVDYLFPKFELAEIDDSGKTLDVQVADRDLCPKYLGRIIRNVKIAPSPSWLQIQLLKVGMRPINNVVDITNYVMLELGQPLHAFDMDKLMGNRIVVRHARPGEELVTLDGRKRVLDEDVLVIADEERAIAVAGVMGGEDTEVGKDTVDIFLESALFDAVSVRRTSKRLGLSTEASYRFERGVDPLITEFALDRAAYLMAHYAGGSVVSGRIGDTSYRYVPTSVYVTVDRVNKLLGVTLSEEDIIYILDTLNFAVKKEGEGLSVRVPSYRLDVENEADIVEEVGRLYGYDKIPFTMPVSATISGGIGERERLLNVIKGVFISAGMNEVITYSFIDPLVWDRWRLGEEHPFRNGVILSNPLSTKQSFMRTSVLPGLLEVAQLNYRRGRQKIALFECGKCFYGDRTEEGLPTETLKVAGVVVPYEMRDILSGSQREYDFYDLKGAVEFLMMRVGIEEYSFKASKGEIFHPKKSASLCITDSVIGEFGVLHPRISDYYELPIVYAFEFDVGLVEKHFLCTRKVVKPIPKYPAVVRDIAVVVPDAVKSGEVKEVIRKVGGKLIEEVKLFDLYKGRQVPAGYKSLAYSIVYRSMDKTLTEEEVNAVQDRIMTVLGSKGFRIRRDK